MCFNKACHVMSQVLFFINPRYWTQFGYSRTDKENHYNPGHGNSTFRSCPDPQDFSYSYWTLVLPMDIATPPGQDHHDLSVENLDNLTPSPTWFA